MDVRKNKILPILYVIETFRDMRGETINAINYAMASVPEILKDVANENPTAEVKIGVLQYSTGAKWLTDNGLIKVEDYIWNDVKASD